MWDKEAAAALAQEVKKPLELIKVNAALLSSRVEDKRPAELILKEVERINGVIADSNERELVFLEDLLCDVVEEYHITDSKRVEFTVEAWGDDLCVFASYSKLCILFYNIFKNAVEAVEEQGKITADIKRQCDMVTVCVTDNGNGISEDIAKEVGKAYFTTKPDGMGLGLAVSKRIAEEYGGSVELTQNKDGGCCAVVKLRGIKYKGCKLRFVW
jgi:two-component system sporulation sensor kinase B